MGYFFFYIHSFVKPCPIYRSVCLDADLLFTEHSWEFIVDAVCGTKLIAHQTRMINDKAKKALSFIFWLLWIPKPKCRVFVPSGLIRPQEVTLRRGHQTCQASWGWLDRIVFWNSAEPISQQLVETEYKWWSFTLPSHVNLTVTQICDLFQSSQPTIQKNRSLIPIHQPRAHCTQKVEAKPD